MKTLTTQELKKRSKVQLISILQGRTHNDVTRLNAAQVLKTRFEKAGLEAVPNAIAETIAALYIAEPCEFCGTFPPNLVTGTTLFAVDNAEALRNLVETFETAPVVPAKSVAKKQSAKKTGKTYKKSGERSLSMTTVDGVKIESGAGVKFAIKLDGEWMVVHGTFKNVNKNVHSPAGYAVIEWTKLISADVTRITLAERVLSRVWSKGFDAKKILKALQ